MKRNTKLKRLVIDPKYLESIRNSFRHLTGEITVENALKIIKFERVEWNSLSDSTTYPFGYKIQIH